MTGQSEMTFEPSVAKVSLARTADQFERTVVAGMKPDSGRFADSEQHIRYTVTVAGKWGYFAVEDNQ